MNVAPGTACANCHGLGHFCPAYEIDEGRALCLACLDGAVCNQMRRRGGSVVVQETLETVPILHCTRCLKPRHRGQCAGVAQKRETKIMPVGTQVVDESKEILPKSLTSMDVPVATPWGQSISKESVVREAPAAGMMRFRLVPITEIPAPHRQVGRHDELVLRIRALAPGMSLELTLANAKAAARYAQQISNVLVRRKLHARYRQVAERVFIWKREASEGE